MITIGCDNGTDWEVEHIGDAVKLTTQSGKTTVVPIEEYTAEVLRFADKVEAFYNQCSPKIIPEDEFDRKGYIGFWNEWHRRYRNAKQ